MNFIETARFKKAYQSLPGEVKARVKEALRKLADNPRYPSLQVKKIKATKDIWEARISLDYRMTFQIVRDYYILRNVGHHDPTLKNP
ncbi:MAG: hypothetical protein Q7J72_03855 [Candidatus Omnitrophota bacterium]|nr:hypothetical protein [Candidatus Omnitrophota bacterium]